MRNYYYIVIGIGIFCLIILIVGMSITGGPFSQRFREFDKERIGDFRSISLAIDNYYRLHHTLPSNLSTISFNLSNEEITLDPETKSIYEYNMKSDISYDLCTNFSLASNNLRDNLDYPYSKVDYSHRKGYDCITYFVQKNPNYYLAPTLYPTTPIYNTEKINFISMGSQVIDNNIAFDIQGVNKSGMILTITVGVQNFSKTKQLINISNLKLYDNLGQSSSPLSSSLTNEIPTIGTKAYHEVKYTLTANSPFSIKYTKSDGSDVLLATFN